MKVKIKDWTELEKIAIYVDEDGELILPNTFWFTSDMEFKLPLDRIIEINEDNQWITSEYTYIITDDMIEKVYLDELPEEVNISIEEPAESLDKSELDLFAINLEVIDAMARRNGYCHYLKWKLTDNLSVRYFYNFEDKVEMSGKFTLKNHKEKELVEISKATAKEMICSFCVETYEEIIGYNVKKLGYKKYIKKFGGEFKEFVNI